MGDEQWQRKEHFWRIMGLVGIRGYVVTPLNFVDDLASLL